MYRLSYIKWKVELSSAVKRIILLINYFKCSYRIAIGEMIYVAINMPEYLYWITMMRYFCYDLVAIKHTTTAYRVLDSTYTS